MQIFINILENTWSMALAAAPWLVVGLIVAALIKVYVSSSWMSQFLKGKAGVVKAAFIGAPLPLCSCGVIPAALAIRRQGASKSSVMSFLVATPETGVDSVAVSYALLGPFLAVVRPISAIFSAIVTGLIGASIPESSAAEVDSSTDPDSSPESSTCCSSKPKKSCCESEKPSEPKATCCSSESHQTEAKPESSCCSSKSETPEPQSSCCSSKAASEPKSSCCSSQAKPEPESSCCSSKTETKSTSSCCSSNQSNAGANKPGLFVSMIDAAGQIMTDTAKWLLIGLFMAGIISVFLDDGTLAKLGSSIWVMLLMVVVGIPMYICAVASTPLAASLLLAGLSPGAVLVFMLAGPATNVATLGVVRKELGTRYMIAYLIGVSASAIICGLATDAIASAMGIVASTQAAHSHEHEMIPEWLAITCLVVLVLLAIKPLRMKLTTLSPQPA